MPSMEIRHLKYFVKSAELLHFTRAAEALHVSQPTLSHQIQQLEDELGTALFERGGRKVLLTEAGKLFLEHALRVLGELEAGQQRLLDLQGRQGPLQGTLRIGVTQLLSSSLLPGILPGFLREHPGVQ